MIEPSNVVRDSALICATGLPFVRYLEGHYPEIHAEGSRLGLDEFVDWPLTEAHNGGWKIFCVFSRDPEWLLASSARANASRCPRTVAILARIRGVVRAGFSLLLPGAHVYPHADAITEDSLRCHLGLATNPRAGLRFGQEIVNWEEGRCLLFDGAVPHEAANLGATPRLVCLIDVERSSLESEVLP